MQKGRKPSKRATKARWKGKGVFNDAASPYCGRYSATVLAAALFFVVVGICALFQGGVMSYLGFEYESAGAFFLFFLHGVSDLHSV